MSNWCVFQTEPGFPKIPHIHNHIYDISKYAVYFIAKSFGTNKDQL